MNCSICKKLTNESFNIALKQIPICGRCSNVVALQQFNYLVRKDLNEVKKVKISNFTIEDALELIEHYGIDEVYCNDEEMKCLKENNHSIYEAIRHLYEYANQIK